MLGDICHTCQTEETHEGCGCSSEPQPNLPCDTGECKVWLPMECVFWMGDDIPNTPIKKGTRLTVVITHLLSRIKALEA